MFRQNRKALSPVIAGIILIAVTVAVSIAASTWIGTITIGFMQTEQLAITEVSFQESTTKTIQVLAKNTASSSVTINEVWINGEKQNFNPQIVQANSEIDTIVNYNWISGARYEIKLVSAKGNNYLYIIDAIPEPTSNPQIDDNPQPVEQVPIVTDYENKLPTYSSGGFAKYSILETKNIWAGTDQSKNQEYANAKINNPGQNKAIFTYELEKNSIQCSLNEAQVTYPTTSEDKTSDQIISEKTSVNPSSWNVIVITITNSSPDTKLSLDDVYLCSFFLGSFTIKPSNTNYWTITNYNFNKGFSLTGTITIDGTFKGESESNMILIEVGTQ